MNKAKAHIAFLNIGGREGISKRILEIAKEIVEQNTYKRATAGAGQLQILAEIAFKADAYWSEMVMRGYCVEANYLIEGCKKPFLREDGHLDFERTEKTEGV